MMYKRHNIKWWCVIWKPTGDHAFRGTYYQCLRYIARKGGHKALDNQDGLTLNAYC